LVNQREREGKRDRKQLRTCSGKKEEELVVIAAEEEGEELVVV